MCMCVRTYVYVCLRKCVRACVRVVSRASPILTRKRMHVRKWEEGGKEKYV